MKGMAPKKDSSNIAEILDKLDDSFITKVKQKVFFLCSNLIDEETSKIVLLFLSYSTHFQVFLVSFSDVMFPKWSIDSFASIVNYIYKAFFIAPLLQTFNSYTLLVVLTLLFMLFITCCFLLCGYISFKVQSKDSPGITLGLCKIMITLFRNLLFIPSMSVFLTNFTCVGGLQISTLFSDASVTCSSTSQIIMIGVSIVVITLSAILQILVDVFLAEIDLDKNVSFSQTPFHQH